MKRTIINVESMTTSLIWRYNDSYSLVKPDNINPLDKYNDINYYSEITGKALDDIPECKYLKTVIGNNGIISCYDTTNNKIIIYDLLDITSKEFTSLLTDDNGLEASPFSNILVCNCDTDNYIYVIPTMLIKDDDGNNYGYIDMDMTEYEPDINGLYKVENKIKDFCFTAKPYIRFKGLPDGTIVKLLSEDVNMTKITDELYFFYNYSDKEYFKFNFTRESLCDTFLLEVV